MPVTLRAALTCTAALVVTALTSTEARAQQASAPTAPIPSSPGPSLPPSQAASPGFPPAPSAIPAPVYYPQPGAPPYYGLSQYYYSPGSTLPLFLPYEQGQPVPPGYRVKTHASRSLLISGAVTFGVPYVVSTFVASAVLSVDTNSGEPLAPLIIPLAGPFITIGTTHAQGVASFWLIIDGLAQIGGAALFAGGLMSEERFLQRVGAQPVAARLLPEVRVLPGFASLRWQF